MNNKVCGPATDFTLVKEEGTRTVISYDLQEEAGKELATWREIYFPKKQVAKPTIEMVKDAILADIDAQTDEKILDGYEFTPDGADTPIIVWLSKESQTNFSEAHRLQIVPVKFKLNETADKHPIYHTFETFEELNRFYVGGVTYINQCLNEGWQCKDSIDWDAYAAALDPEYTPKKKTTKK